MACKEGQFNLVELIVNIEGINLNVQNVNGITPFDLAVHNVRLLYYILYYL